MLQTPITPASTDRGPALPRGWYPCRRCLEPTPYLSFRGAICEARAGGPYPRLHAGDND